MGAGMRTRVLSLLSALLFAIVAMPAHAAVTITFWSHDFGNSFPHAFIMLRGTPDAGGAAVDASYGFTAKSITPKLLFGNVAGRIERPKRAYMAGSHVRFARTLTDTQYAAVLALIREWDERTGDATYNLSKRNCVTFVREAARRSGLEQVDFPRLMKKPASYLHAVMAAQPDAVVAIEQMGKTYLPTLPAVDATVPIEAPTSTPPAIPGRRQPAPQT